MTTGKVLKDRRSPRERGRMGGSLTSAAAAAAAGRSSRALIALLAPQRLLLHPASLLLAVFAQLLFLLDARGLGLFRLLTQRLLPFLIERGVGFFPLSRLGRFPMDIDRSRAAGRTRRSVARITGQTHVEREVRVKSDDGESPQGMAFTARARSYGKQSVSPGRQRRLLGHVEVQQRRVRDARVRHRRPGRGLRAELLVRAEREREVRR